jgi:hypothetical protein
MVLCNHSKGNKQKQTIQTIKQRRNKTMIGPLVVFGVWGVVSVGVYFTLKNI